MQIVLSWETRVVKWTLTHITTTTISVRTLFTYKTESSTPPNPILFKSKCKTITRVTPPSLFPCMENKEQKLFCSRTYKNRTTFTQEPTNDHSTTSSRNGTPRIFNNVGTYSLIYCVTWGESVCTYIVRVSR